MKTLIAYATRYGATARTANLLAEELRKAGLADVAVMEAGRARRGDLAASDFIIIGSSIAAGLWKGAARRLLARAARSGKPTAVFVSAGGAMTGRKPGSDPSLPVTSTLEERAAEAVERYLSPAVARAGLKPVAVNAFGGRMAMFGKEQFDNWDPDRIKAWAAELAPKIR